MIHMAQKDYSLEVVSALIKGKNHIRGISQLLDVNHMTISRKIAILEELNVADFIQEGRNKVYFLKDSPEARSLKLMSENYSLVCLVLKYPFLRELVKKVQGDKRISSAFIFGSYAKNRETKKSDIDIYLEVTDSRIKKEYSEIDSKFSIKIGKWDKKNLLIKEIIENHVIIKGGERFYDEFLS